MGYMQALSGRTRNAAGLGLLLLMLLLLLHGGQAKQLSVTKGGTHVECQSIASSVRQLCGLP